jgi:hypothetical protein
MSFSGIMIIGGNHILPRTWYQMATALLGPEPLPGIRANRRRATRSTPGAPRTWTSEAHRQSP